MEKCEKYEKSVKNDAFQTGNYAYFFTSIGCSVEKREKYEKSVKNANFRRENTRIFLHL